MEKLLKLHIIMTAIGKRFLKSSAITLLALFFIFEGFINITDSQTKTQFEVKIYNMEVYLNNRGYLLLPFEKLINSISFLILPIFGLLMTLCGLGFIFFEEKGKRARLTEVLIVLQIIDALIIHNPFIENQEMRSLEMKHFMLDILIVFALVMVVGFRE